MGYFNSFLVGVLTGVVLTGRIYCWPDGAPCLSKVMKSMYPSAPEHDGGLRTDDPPYRIRVDRMCYSEGTRIGVVLEAQEGYRFKGFAMQARKVGNKERTGEFSRDDNGSWKFQCFTKKNAITHSHSDLKKRVPTIWFTWEHHQEEIQFVATVVQETKSFWYESVKSIVIPHCFRGLATTLLPPQADILYQPAIRPRGFPYDPNVIEPTRTTTVSTIPPTTVLITTTTTKGPCIDKHPSCDAWQQFCKLGNWYVIEQCRLTCGDCVPNHNPPPPPTTPWKPAATLPRPRGNCPNKHENCKLWHHLCDLQSVVDLCPGTCNACDKQRKSNGFCYDENDLCPSWKSMCSYDHISVKCRFSCGLC